MNISDRPDVKEIRDRFEESVIHIPVFINGPLQQLTKIYDRTLENCNVEELEALTNVKKNSRR